MGKGFFTQGFVILLSETVTLDSLRRCLSGTYNIVKEVPGSNESWEFSGPSLVLEYKPDVNGYVSIDVADQQWPDHMGDPKSESMLFATWSMGHFGPYAYPYGLRRASEQSWRWSNASASVKRHSAFVRIRTSYIFGAGKDALVMPGDYDPIDELNLMTDIAQLILQLPEAICFFNPNGEVLLPIDELRDLVSFSKQHGLPALDVWCNTRLFNLERDWLLMDTVGNWQMDMADHEAAFHRDQFSPKDVDNFLRNASLYILEKGPIIADGNTMDGPGNIRWKAYSFENALSDPPRDVLRWIPTNAKDTPALLLPQKQSVDSLNPSETQSKKPWWKKW